VIGLTDSGSASVSESESKHEMTFNHEERTIRRGAALHEEAGARARMGIDTDSDSDSDPEARNSAGQPDKPLELTRLSCRARRAAPCAGSSTPR
jgi:hypothetical protein